MTFGDEERQTGQTIRQMQAAAHGVLFVWHNGRLGYPRDMAKALGRHDLVIVSPLWLTHGQWFGRAWPGVVVDHATRLTAEQQRGLTKILARKLG